MKEKIICGEKRYCKNNPTMCWMCERNEVNDILEDCFDRRPDKTIKIHLLSHGYNGSRRYACNFAVDPIDFKITEEPAKVTCKNCLKIVANEEMKKQ